MFSKKMKNKPFLIIFVSLFLWSCILNYRREPSIYDYTGSHNSKFNAVGIIPGKDLNDPAQRYTFGPSRRKTPENI